MRAYVSIVPGVVLFVTSLLLSSFLAPRGVVSRLLALWLLAYAQIVLLTEVLSESRLIGARGYLAGQVVLLAGAVALWRLAGRPRVAIGTGELLVSTASFVREHLALSLFAAAVAALAVVNVAWCFLYPPLDGDANAYHLPRAYYFTTLGTARHFPTSDFRMTQTPPNASFVFAWLLAFSRGFRGLHLPQASAGFALACAVAGLARLSGRDRARSLFAGALGLTFPIVILEMGTSQTDLMAAACGAAAAYFGFRALLSEEGDRSRDALCFGLSLGLGLGTKLTVFFLLPGLVIGLVVLSRSLRGGVSRLILLAAWGVGGFAVFGAYNFVLNAWATTRAGEGGVRRVAYRKPVFEEHLREEVIAKLANLLPPLFPQGATLGIVSEYNDTVFHLFRSLPDLDFVPVSEDDAPRLVREGRLAAAVVGEFRNVVGQGVTKPGFPLPRNAIHVANPEEFFRRHPGQFGAELVAKDGELEAVLPIERDGVFSGESFVLRVPTGLARAVGAPVALWLPVASASRGMDPAVRVACGGISAPTESSAGGLVVPIPNACLAAERVYMDLGLTRPAGGAPLVLKGEARLVAAPRSRTSR